MIKFKSLNRSKDFIKILKKLRMQEALRLLVDTPIEEEITEAIEILKQKKQKKRARKSNKS